MVSHLVTYNKPLLNLTTKEISTMVLFKGILSYVKELILTSSETYFVSKSEVSLPLNQAKTENPGTSSALKSGYPEEYLALKTGYPEE